MVAPMSVTAWPMNASSLASSMLVVLMISLLGFVVLADARRPRCREREGSVKAAITLRSRNNHEHRLSLGHVPSCEGVCKGELLGASGHGHRDPLAAFR